MNIEHRTPNIENVEWEKMKKQTYDLEERVLGTVSFITLKPFSIYYKMPEPKRNLAPAFPYPKCQSCLVLLNRTIYPSMWPLEPGHLSRSYTFYGMKSSFPPLS